MLSVASDFGNKNSGEERAAIITFVFEKHPEIAYVTGLYVATESRSLTWVKNYLRDGSGVLCTDDALLTEGDHGGSEQQRYWRTFNNK